MLFAKATNRILFKFLKRIREPIWQSYHSSSQIIFSYGNNLEAINFAFAVYSLLHCVLLVVESGPSLFLYSIHWPQGRRQPVSIPSIAFWMVWGCIWRVSHRAYCPWPGCPSMKSLTVQTPHTFPALLTSLLCSRNIFHWDSARMKLNVVLVYVGAWNVHWLGLRTQVLCWQTILVSAQHTPAATAVL